MLKVIEQNPKNNFLFFTIFSKAVVKNGEKIISSFFYSKTRFLLNFNYFEYLQRYNNNDIKYNLLKISNAILLCCF